MFEPKELLKQKKLNNLTSLAQNTLKNALKVYETFANNKAHPSFHNHTHVAAVVKSAQLLVEFAEQNDVFNLKEDLARYNQSSTQPAIQFDELSDLLTIAFALHDLGNIVTFEDEEFAFRTHYVSKNAEDTSIALVHELLDNQHADFVSHIIDQTRFSPKALAFNNIPFNKFVGFCDQVGGSILNTSSSKEIALGLLYEWQPELGDGFEISDPYYFMNFSREKIREFLPTEEQQRSALDILGVELPNEITNVPKEQITLIDFIEFLETTFT